MILVILVKDIESGNVSRKAGIILLAVSLLARLAQTLTGKQSPKQLR